MKGHVLALAGGVGGRVGGVNFRAGAGGGEDEVAAYQAAAEAALAKCVALL